MNDILAVYIIGAVLTLVGIPLLLYFMSGLFSKAKLKRDNAAAIAKNLATQGAGATRTKLSDLHGSTDEEKS